MSNIMLRPWSFPKLFLLLLSFPIYVSAQNTLLPELSKHPEWLNLLHYHREGVFNTHYHSYIDDPAFFLAQDGAINPTAELQATLDAFYIPVTKDSYAHALCRFPARRLWLENLGQIDVSRLPQVDCSDFNKWYAEMDADSITLIFAAAYLNSPSSMFGHTLMRMDNSKADDDTNWLAYAINFGANINNDDNSLLYAFKGISGGYNGLFHIVPFYKKIQEYSFMENRELWEYKLNLTASETERLLLHLWELQDINFSYYYVSENCSFRLLELLQVARPGVQLTENFKYTAIPSDIIQTVAKHGFVQSIHYRLPQAKQLAYRIAETPKQYYKLIDELTSLNQAPSDTFNQLPLEQQRELVDTAYQLLRFQTLKSVRTPDSARQKLKLLRLLNSYTKPDKPARKYPIPTSPDKGHGSHLASLAVGYERDQLYTQLSYRQNYHDLLDNPAGYFSGAEINFFDLNIRIYETGNVKLQKLKLLNITSLSPRNHFIKPVSWRLDIGLEYQNYARNKLSVYFNGGAGLSYNFFKNGLTYGFLNGYLEYSPDFKYTVEPGIGLQLGQLFQSTLGTSQLEFNSKIFIDGSYLYSIGFDHNFILSTDHAIRFSVQQTWNKSTSFNNINLSYRYYF